MKRKTSLLLLSVFIIASQSQAIPGVESCDFSNSAGGSSSQGYLRVRTLQDGGVREELFTNKSLVIKTTEGKSTTKHVFASSLFDPEIIIEQIFYAGKAKDLPNFVVVAKIKNMEREEVYIDQLFFNPPRIYRLATFPIDANPSLSPVHPQKMEVKVGQNTIMTIDNTEPEGIAPRTAEEVEEGSSSE